ncbi:MAG: hypothetical protein CVV28_11825 [Methanobacteriales archaeon HGW-Methanobacteriales-1]|jgi:hypothetical protein|nr:MAG: hypothetical protein CVV28_11825 [Methanobacteriales archaeon HGW-Methanobacteriales-1]
MITVKLMGGIGNQLFQYAFGRSISSDLHTELLFDLSHYDSDYSKSLRHDNYALKHFKIENIEFYKYSDELIDESSEISIYKEDFFNEITGFPLFRNFSAIQLPAYFEGYWQSEKYFIHNEKIIRENFQFKKSLSGKNKLIAKDILDHDSVAMHIRRGDYLDYTKFGVCTEDYYQKSISFIEKQVKNPKFFIFSDDPEWVKKNIHIPHPTYHVTNNSVENGHKDLQLMSLCKNFIIANSTFSWWGSWLSNNKNKIITIPKPWFIYRDPNLRHIDYGKRYFPINNDHREDFNSSNLVLFRLKPENYSLDLASIHNIDLTTERNRLNVNVLGNDSKIYLREIKKSNDDNNIIMKLSLKTKFSDIFQLYYTTNQSSTYNDKNCIYFHYHENEDFEIFIYLSKEILLKNIMIVPSSIKGSELCIKSLEIREINNSKKLYSKLYNKICTFRKFLS